MDLCADLDGVHCKVCCGVLGNHWAIVFGRAFVHVAMAMAMADLAKSKMLDILMARLYRNIFGGPSLQDGDIPIFSHHAVS